MLYLLSACLALAKRKKMCAFLPVLHPTHTRGSSVVHLCSAGQTSEVTLHVMTSVYQGASNEFHVPRVSGTQDLCTRYKSCVQVQRVLKSTYVFDKVAVADHEMPPWGLGSSSVTPMNLVGVFSSFWRQALCFDPNTFLVVWL